MHFKHTFPTNYSLLQKSQMEQLENLFIYNYQLITPYKAVNIRDIVLEYHSKNSSILASFDIVKSTDSLHFFHIYPRFTALLNEDLKRLEKIILHEIIHALDHTILHKQHTLAQIKSISTQHAFIHFLATIRNEGVAVLVQKLLHEETVTETLESAFLILENELNTILRSCISNAIHQRITWNEFQSILHQLHQKVNNYSGVIAFSFMKVQLNLNQCQELNDFIKLSTKDEKKKLISHLFKMDVSEWIQQLIKMEQTNVIRLEIKLELLVHLCSLLNPKIYKEYHTLLDDIPRYAYQNDTANIIRILEQIVPEKLNISEIRIQLKKMNIHFLSDNLEIEILYLCQELLLQRNEQSMHLIDLALSYYITKQDIIHDETLFLGMQDDWIVLDSIFLLLNLFQN